MRATAKAATRNPFVDIGMPTHRRPVLLAGAVRSVVSQQHEGWRAIIVDNASGDATAQVVQSFDDERIILRTNRTMLPRVENYNLALRSADNEFVAILADDEHELWVARRSFPAVSRLTRPAEFSRFLDCPGPHRLRDNRCTRAAIGSRAAPHPRAARSIDGSEYVRWLVEGTHQVQFTATVLRRSALPISGFDPRDQAADDLGLLLRSAWGRRVAVLPDVLVRVRVHGDSVSASASLGGASGYVFDLPWRLNYRNVKVRFVDECVQDPTLASRLSRAAERSLRRSLLVPSARALRSEGLRAAALRLLHDLRLGPLALIDPQAWKRAVAVYLGR